MKKRTNILMLGGPGSGKGTSGQYLSGGLNLMHLSTGEAYRKHIKDETPIGLRVKEAIAAGGLADDETSVEVTRIQLKESSGVDFPTVGHIFDGFPRTLSQAPLLDGLINELELGELDLVIYLNVSDETLLTRLKDRALVSGRVEDSDEEYCKKRIRVFHEQTEPLIQLYREKGILREIPECDLQGLYSELDKIVAEITENV